MKRSLFSMKLLAVVSLVGCSAAPLDEAPQPPIAPAKGGPSATLPFREADGSVRSVPVAISDGRAWIGDMGFGRADDLRPRGRTIGTSTDTDLRWPDGRVHYCFLRGALSNELDPPASVEPVVAAAAAYIEARVPSVHFVNHGHCSELEPPADDYVVIRRYVNDDGVPQGNARAETGRRGGAQVLDLGFEIGNEGPEDGRGTVVHELLHSLGMWHEHQRSDRDDHIAPCWLNVDKVGDMEIKADQLLLSKYDYHSLLHYRPNQNTNGNVMPAPCGKKSFYPLDPNVALVKNGNMTAEDINTLSVMYGYPIGRAVEGQQYGAAISVGNFDGDGYDDIAVSAPGRSDASGIVYLFKGTKRYPIGRRTLQREANPGKGDLYGTAMAAGDFNGDGIMDLAVGVPGSRVTGVRSGGVVIYIGGRHRGAYWEEDCSDGTKCAGNDRDMIELPYRTLRLGANPTNPQPAEGDLFGASLVAGDFDGDGKDDLVVGAPGRNGGTGAAFYFTGKNIAPAPGSPPTVYTFQSILPADFGAYPNVGRFGASLARGDFDDDGQNDLAIGSPGASGRVFVARGTGTTKPAPFQVIASPNGTGDEFGFSVATGRLFGDDTHAELVVGAPLTQNSPRIFAGAVHVYQWGAASSTSGERLVHADEMVTGTAGFVRFGHAVQVLNFDREGRHELAIGAPNYASGKGRILMATSNGSQLAVGPDVVGGFGVQGLGTSLAAIVQEVGPTGIESNVARLLAGAPRSEGLPGMTSAGQTIAYGEKGSNDFNELTKLNPDTKSPVAE